ncbi:MAG: hypothetical protein HZB51_00040 [Chloroflexi bacterium]|nr:hypothetical protein [Chloroflexota bacterium]
MRLDLTLNKLENADLLRPATDEEQTFMFAHALVQDTVYASMLKQDRRHLHRMVGEVLEQVYVDHIDEFAALLAHHFALAGDDKKTLQYAVRAGDAAMRVYAYHEARSLYEKALTTLDRLENSDEHCRLRADTLVKQVSISYPYQHSSTSFKCLMEAEAIVQDLYVSTQRDEDRLRLARIHYWLGRMHGYRNETHQAIDNLMLTLQEAGNSNDETLLAFPSAVIGRLMNIQGQFGAAEALLQQAVGPLEKGENWAEWVSTLGQLALAQAARGRASQAVENGTRVLQRAMAIKNVASIAEAQAMLAAIYFMIGDYDRMAKMARVCIQTAESSETRLYCFLGYAMLALAQSEQGEPDNALASIQRAAEIDQTMLEGRVYSDWYAAVHAQVILNIGESEEACELARQGVQLAQSIGGIFSVGLSERVWALGLAQRHADWEKIETHLEKSLNAFETGDARVESARTHAAWGKLLQARGQYRAAREHLELAIDRFQEAELTRELNAARQALSERVT